MRWFKRKTPANYDFTRNLAARRIRPMLETLEERVTPTSNLYLDFGDLLPSGGFDLTVGQLRQTFGNGGIQGPDLRVFDNNNNVIDYQDNVNLRFGAMAPLVTFDYDQNGVVNGADYTALRTAVISLVQRYYAPFDVNIVIAPALDTTSSATYLAGIQTTLQLGANVDGERDCWVFVGSWIRTDTNVAVGQDRGLNGIAAGADIGGPNARDDSAITFADNILPPGNILEADTRLAYTAAHEAGHTFGLQHTFNDGNSGNAQLNSDLAMQSFSNLVTDSATAINRTNFVFATRFNLVRGDNNTGGAFNINDTVNHYNQLAAANGLGLRAGAPAYVTGTGAFDQINITRIDATTAQVNVSTFREATYTNQIGSTFSYVINFTNGVLIEAGFNIDQITIDATIAANFTVRGMAAADRLIVNGNGASVGNYTPGTGTTTLLDGNTYFSGQFNVTGGAQIALQELLAGGTIFVQNFAEVGTTGSVGDDSFILTKPTANQFNVNGTVSGQTLLTLIGQNNAAYRFTGGAGTDVLTVNHSGRLVNTNIFFDGGFSAGDNDRLVHTGNPGFTVARGTYRVGATEDAGFYVLDGDGSMGAGAFGVGNGDECIVNFTGLEPIDDDVPAAIFDIILSINDDFGAVQNAAPLNGFAALQLTDINGTFETTRWANKTTVTFSGNQGADTVVFDYTTPSAGLTTLGNYGNAAPGIPLIDDFFPDVFVVLNSANGILHFNNGQGGLDRSWFGVTPATGFNVGGGTLNGVQGLYTITDSDQLAEYLIDDSGNGGGRNYQFLDSAGDNRLTSASLPNLNLLFDGDTYFSLQMAMGAGVDNITITANNAGGFANFPTLSFFGNAGNDSFTVTPSTTAFINVDGGPPVFGDPGVPPGDRLIITTPGSTVTPLGSPDGVVTTPGRFPVNFVSIETVIVPDRFEINNTPALATFLGSDPFMTLRDLSIHSVDDPLTLLVNEADVDFFRYTAHDTGYLVIHAQYVSSVGGQLVVEVFRRPQDALDPLAFNNPANYITSIPAAPGSIDGTRLVIPVVAQTVYYIRVRGADQLVDVNNYALELENFKAPIPTVVDLLASSDSGRFNNDNITNDTTPTFNIQADLAFLAAQGIPILTAAQAAAGTFLGAAVEVSINVNGTGTIVTFFADPIAASGNTIFSFTPPVPLPDGQHQITAAVRMFDPRLPTPVNGREQLGSPPLSFIIDTVAPVAPTLRLVNDTGVNGDAATFNDRVTRDPLSPFSGVSENGSLVRLFANGFFMGDNYANLTGQWLVNLQTSLNNPAFFAYDGLRAMAATAEDLAGNVSAATLLDVAIDTQGPNVIDLFAIDANGNVVPVDLLDPAKPSLQPTTQVAGLKIVFEDFPLRLAGFLPGWNAINQLVGSDPINYVVRGQKYGVIPIASVVVTNFNFAGLPGFAEVDLTFFAPLKDDVYTLEISPRVTDDPGNPVPNVPGGIVLQFTVDAQPELGIYAGGTINIDLNGNFVDDGAFGDIKFKYNPPGSQVFVGQFTDEFGAADGFDRLGVYGRLANRKLGVQLDFDNDGVFDYVKTLTLQINGTAIAGNFSDFKDGDEIGIFTGKKWYLDTNGNNDIDPGDTVLTGNMRGLPIVGDFDGDGLDDLATFQNNKFYFDLAFNGLTGNADRVMNFGLPTRLDRPVAADWDLDGITDVGLWTPGRSTTIGAAKAEWFWVVSDGTPIPDRDPQNDFRVEPFGRDFVATFGNPKAMPIVGNFDPPLVPSQNQAAQAQAFGGPGFDGSTLAALGAEAYFTLLYQQRHGNG